jgi:hypothetical protein
MRELDPKEKKFYERLINYLENKFGYDCKQEVFELHSGDNSVIMKGEFGGYSLFTLKKYVADVQGKKTIYDQDEY